MKRFATGAALAAVLLAISPGVHSQDGGRVVVDQIVAVVGGSAIFYSEVDRYASQIVEERREKGYTSDRDPKSEALERLMTQKLLYNQALIDSVKINTSDIDQMIEESTRQEIKQRGSLAAVEAFYHKPIFAVKEDMRQRATEMRYASAMQRDIQDKIAITPGEVDSYFRSIPKDSLPLVPEQYVYAQIVKFPPSIKEAKERVREQLLEMRQRILNGTRFDLLARMYSVDGSSVRGGEMDPAPKETYVAPFADALVKLKPGQVSEVVETEFGYHLIQLIDKTGNLYHCRHILLRPVYTAEEISATTVVLDSLVTLIRKGDLTFEKAALENSDDKYSKLNGGVVSNHDMLEMYNYMDPKLTSTRFPKEDLMPSDYRVIRNLKPGDISDAFMTEDLKGNQEGKVIKLLQVVPTHTADITEDYLAIENMALETKQDKVFVKWLDSKISGMYIRIDPAFRSSDFQDKAWFK